MATVGEVKYIKIEHEVEWKILYFSSLSSENSVYYFSSNFSFCKESWYLSISPNGHDKTSVGYISLFLIRKSSGPPIKIEFSIGLKTFSGEKLSKKNFEYIFKHEEDGYGYGKYCLRSEVFEKKADLLPADVITVFCTLKFPKSDETPNHEKVVSDLKEILLNGELSDILVKVKGKEFRLHKAILAARNSYFNAMFKNDMKEKITGVVSIDDCEPHIFSSFIHFLYTGNVEKLSSENMYDLYEIANKYQEDQLKKKCCDFMLNSMSVDNLCDAVVLALRFDDRILLQEAAKYFAWKMKEVIRSVKWQDFLLEYPIQANELLIKAVDYSDNK